MIVNFKTTNNGARVRENNYNVQQKKVKLGIQEYEYEEMDYSKYDPMGANSKDVIAQQKMSNKKEMYKRYEERINTEVPNLIEFYQNSDLSDNDKEYILGVLNNMDSLLSSHKYADINSVLNQLTTYKDFKIRMDKELPELLNYYMECDLEASDKENILNALNNLDALLLSGDFYDVNEILTQLTLLKNQYEAYDILNGKDNTQVVVAATIRGIEQYYYVFSPEKQEAATKMVNKYYEILNSGDVEAAKTYYQEALSFYNDIVKPEMIKAIDMNKKDYTYHGNAVDAYFSWLSGGYNWGIDKVSDGMYFAGNKLGINEILVESKVGKYLTELSAFEYNVSQEINKQTFSMLEGAVDAVAYAAAGSKAKSFIAYDFTSNLLNVFNPDGMYTAMADSYVENEKISTRWGDIKLLTSDSITVSLIGGAYRCTAGIAIGQAVGGDAVLALGKAKISTASFITASLFGIETFGQTLQGEYNKNKVKLTINGSEIKLNIDYSTYKRAENLKEGEKLELANFSIKDENGNNIVVKLTLEKKDGKYNVYDQLGNTYDLEALIERSDRGAEVKSLLYGTFEVAQWLTAAKINTVGKVALDGKLIDASDQVIKNVFTRVALDIFDGAIEVPIRTGIDWATDRNLTLTEAWQGQGGWKSLVYQAALGGIMSFGSEYITNKEFRTALKNEINLFIKDNNGFLKLGASDSKIDITDGDSIIKYVNENAINLSDAEKKALADDIIKSNIMDLSNKEVFNNQNLVDLLNSDPYIGKTLLSDDTVLKRVEYLFQRNPGSVGGFSKDFIKLIDSSDTLNKYLSIDCVNQWFNDLSDREFVNCFIYSSFDNVFDNSALGASLIRERFKKLGVLSMTQKLGASSMQLSDYMKTHSSEFSEFFDFYKNIDVNISTMDNATILKMLDDSNSLRSVLDEADYNKIRQIKNNYEKLVTDKLLTIPGVSTKNWNYELNLENLPKDCSVFDLVVDVNGKKEMITLKKSLVDDSTIEFTISSNNRTIILDGEIEGIVPNYAKSDLRIPVDKNSKYQIDVEFDGRKQTIYRSSYGEYITLELYQGDITKVYSATKVDSFSLKNTVDDFSIENNMLGSKSVFLDEHYGGNQSDVPRIYQNPANAVELEKKELFESITRKYMPDASELDMLNLTESYANHGCSYMATANATVTYFSSIENGAEEFAKRFGYDLNIAKGQLSATNVEAVAYELYLYGLKNEYGDITSNVIKKGHGLSKFDYDTIVPDFLESKSIALNSTKLDVIEHFSDDASTLEKLVADINSNKDTFMILNSDHFDLELVGNSFNSMSADEALKNSMVSGNKVLDVGSHAMLITGADANNILTVSSWSDKFKFDLNSIDAIKSKGGYVDIIPLRLSLLGSN